MGPENIIMGCKELSLNLSVLAQRLGILWLRSQGQGPQNERTLGFIKFMLLWTNRRCSKRIYRSILFLINEKYQHVTSWTC